MKKLILTFLPAVLATVLNAQRPASELVTTIATGNKFTQANQRSGNVLDRASDLSKTSTNEDQYFCDSVYGYMFYSYLDSSLNSKYIYLYDAKGHESTFEQYARDNTRNQWIIAIKHTTVYNSTDKMASRRSTYWDTNTKKLSGGWGFDNTFDENGNQIISESYELDTSNNQFVFSHKSEMSYNTNEKLDSSLNYDWDPVIGNWKITSRWVSTYDLDTILILSNLYIWDSLVNQWIDFQKTEFGYDPAGNQNLSLSFNWDKNSSQWMKADSFALAFNEFGQVTLMSFYNWNVNAAQWVGTWKTEEIYDGQKNRVAYISYQWDRINSQWVYDYKSNESYDENGRVVLILSYRYNSINSEWIIKAKEEYYYEENGLKYLSIYSSFIADQWYLGSKYYSYNSMHVLTDLVKPAMANSLVIYPNPAKEWINILSNDPLSNPIQLYNYKGQLLKTVTIDYGFNTINISNLESGLYFFKILSNQPSETYKFIKIE